MESARLCRSKKNHCGRCAAAVIASIVAAPAAAQPPSQPTPLSTLVQEVARANPAIKASLHAWRAGTHAAASASALPGPQVIVQQVAVGSPRPFAGFSSSDFAYIAVGASQELPYPGKRALRAAVANHDADTLLAQSDAVRRQVVESLKLAYVQLAYLQATLPILQRNDRALGEVQQMAESRYRVGQGSQEDVLRAQLQHTTLLEEIASHQQEERTFQAQLKELLGRPQDSPDIVTEPLAPTPITQTSAEMLKRAGETSPEVKARSAQLRRQSSQVDLARRDFKPDFDVAYMYEHTGSEFRDYYMATVTLRLPNRGRDRAALAEGREQQQEAADDLEATRQRVLSDAQQQLVAIQGSNERLTIYREGLTPQANDAFQAAMAAYASNREDFGSLMSSFLDVLNTEMSYVRELADHESAVARLERLTGAIQP